MPRRIELTIIHPVVFISCFLLAAFSFEYLDKPVAYFFHDLHSVPVLYLANILTVLGINKIYLLGFFVWALGYRSSYQYKSSEMRCWFLWLCVFIPTVICILLKVLLGRARPELLFHAQLYGFYGYKTQALYWSFPSGHATTVAGVATGLTLLFPRYTYVWVFFMVVVLLSRLVLTHHYLSDVFLSSYLAMFEVCVLNLWWKPLKE